MGRVRIVTHRGTPIVFQDFSKVSTVEEGLRAIDEARVFVERQRQPAGVLLLTDVSGSTFDQRVVDALKELAQHHKPFVAASAIVGLSPIQRVVYATVVKITGRIIRPFTTQEEATVLMADYTDTASYARLRQLTSCPDRHPEWSSSTAAACGQRSTRAVSAIATWGCPPMYEAGTSRSQRRWAGRRRRGTYGSS